MTDTCNDYLQKLLTCDTKIQKILKNQYTNQYLDIPIHCRDCSYDGIEGNSRAILMNNPLQIILCSNRVKSQADQREALIHELIHVL